MIYEGSFITINNTSLPYIKQFKVGRNKLWKDADRNMSGTVNATLIGIFPKITITTRRLTQEEMAQLCAILDLPYFTVQWFDVRTQTTTTGMYYASDYETEILEGEKSRGLYKGLTVNLIPVARRAYN